VPAGLGRRYSRVGGDINPIHLFDVTAKLFGFDRAIIHGMWTLARCVAELGGREAYWRMADALFLNQAKLSAELIERLAGEQGIDPARLGACAADKKTAEHIDTDIQEASRVGITGTPSFVIGTAKGDIVTGTLVVGAQAETTFAARIEDALKKAEPAR